MALAKAPREARRGRLARLSPGVGVDRRTALIWATGLLLRLAFIPFTAHLDLYHIYSRAYEAAYHGEWFIWGSQIVIQTIHNVWLLLIRPLLPGSATIWSPSAGVLGAGAQPSEFVGTFMTYPLLPRALFLMKLPYLLADIGTGVLLTRLVGPERRRWVLALWWLNPLVIYTSAIFGRHDSIAIFFVVLSIVLAVRGRRVLGLGFLGLGAVTRFFPAFLAPFYVVAFSRTRREAALFLGGLTAIWGVVEVAGWTLTGSSPTLTLLTRYQHVDYLVQLAIPMQWDDSLFVFPAAYTLLLLWFVERGPSGAADYVAGGSAVFLILFALTFFHPPYAIWLVPFLALAIGRDRRLLTYHALQIVLVALYAVHWGKEMTVDLFLPLSVPAIQALPDPMAVVGAQIPTTLYFGVVRSLFTALSLWMAYRILRQRFGLGSIRDGLAAAGVLGRDGDGAE